MANTFWYGQALLKALNKETDFDTNTMKGTLHTSTYAVNQDTHVYASSLTNEVANGNGYTTGGVTLTTKAITYTAGTNVIALDFDDPVWAASTITARYLVVTDTTPGTAATNPLYGYVDFVTDFASQGGEFRVTIDPAGFVKITVS